MIRDLCKFRLLKSPLPPWVHFLTDTRVLLLNVSNATLLCGEQLTRIQIPKCLMCTHESSCNYVLRTWNKEGKIEMSYLPKMASCERHHTETITRKIVNLAVLQHFFNDSQLGRLEGGTLLEKNLSITLPKFRTYDHKFKELLAADGTDKYNLEKFARRVNNDSVIYHLPTTPGLPHYCIELVGSQKLYRYIILLYIV